MMWRVPRRKDQFPQASVEARTVFSQQESGLSRKSQNLTAIIGTTTALNRKD